MQRTRKSCGSWWITVDEWGLWISPSPVPVSPVRPVYDARRAVRRLRRVTSRGHAEEATSVAGQGLTATQKEGKTRPDMRRPPPGGERGSSSTADSGGRSRTGLARSRTIRDFHGVPESLLRQTHTPTLRRMSWPYAQGCGKPLLAPHSGLLRPGQDGHCEVQHAHLQQVLLPRRADQPQGGPAHRIRPVRLPRRRYGPRPDGADSRVPLRDGPRLERPAGEGDRRRDPSRPDRPAHLRRGGLPHRGTPHHAAATS